MLGQRLKIIAILSLSILIAGCVTISPGPQVGIPQGICHIVGSGQTLWRIAKTYNIDIREIMRINRISDPAQIGVGQQLFIPRAKIALPVEPHKQILPVDIEKIVGPKYRLTKWRYITIHHSATSEGNAESFDRNHRRRRMGGLFYHFVIGCGRGSGDGEIEVGWRWRKQEQVNRPFDIQICLVGNFDKQQISEAQFASLRGLINILRRQYNISLSNIRKHKDIARSATQCPGKNFPFYRLLAQLRKVKP